MRLASALTVLALLGLSACDSDTDATLAAARAPIDTPQLWFVETLGGGGSSATFVCADAALRESFANTDVQVKGHPCEDITGPKLRVRAWTLSCRMRGRFFRISASTIGDLGRDYRLTLALTPLGSPVSLGAGRVQDALRFRRVGDCPTGWRVGDRAKAGRRPRKSRVRA